MDGNRGLAVLLRLGTSRRPNHERFGAIRDGVHRLIEILLAVCGQHRSAHVCGDVPQRDAGLAIDDRQTKPAKNRRAQSRIAEYPADFKHPVSLGAGTRPPGARLRSLGLGIKLVLSTIGPALEHQLIEDGLEAPPPAWEMKIFRALAICGGPGAGGQAGARAFCAATSADRPRYPTVEARNVRPRQRAVSPTCPASQNPAGRQGKKIPKHFPLQSRNLLNYRFSASSLAMATLAASSFFCVAAYKSLSTSGPMVLLHSSTARCQ